MDKSIDLTENNIFKKNNPYRVLRKTLAKLDFVKSDNFFPIKYTKEKFNFKKFLKIKEGNENDYKYLGNKENPFFLGRISNFKRYREDLEMFDWQGDNIKNICAKCGRRITILDNDSKIRSIMQYLPHMCNKCLTEYEYVSAIDKIKMRG